MEKNAKISWFFFLAVQMSLYTRSEPGKFRNSAFSVWQKFSFPRNAIKGYEQRRSTFSL